MSDFIKRNSFLLYNLIVAIFFGAALIWLTIVSPYLAEPAETAAQALQEMQTMTVGLSTQTAIAQPGLPSLLYATLITLAFAGGCGGVLCNLRGIFKYYRDEGRLRNRFLVPFIVRPWMGMLVGLFTFFVLSFFGSALTMDSATLSWTRLSGRIPYIGLAMIAGFGSQEFMERLKEVAKTIFSEGEAVSYPVQIDEIYRWKAGTPDIPSGTEPLTTVEGDELILLYGELDVTSVFNWRVFEPGELPCKPIGDAVAVKLSGDSEIKRWQAAVRTIMTICLERNITDWQSARAGDWCK
jgi:hypothetical protein